MRPGPSRREERLLRTPVFPHSTPPKALLLRPETRNRPSRDCPEATTIREIPAPELTGASWRTPLGRPSQSLFCYSQVSNAT